MAQIIGLNELVADLEKADKIMGSTLKKLVKQNAEPVLRQAKSTAPFDTGELRDNLELAFEKARANKRVIYLRTKPGKAIRGYEGRQVPYIYFATGKRTKGNKGTTPGNPFAQEALADNYQRIRDGIEKPLLEAFDRVMNRSVTP